MLNLSSAWLNSKKCTPIVMGLGTKPVGQSPACTSTLSIASNTAHADHTINFLTTMNVTSLHNISLSVEELT